MTSTANTEWIRQQPDSSGYVWQPVDNLEYAPGGEYLIVRDGVIGTGYVDDDFEYSPVNVVLPPNLRLCERVDKCPDCDGYGWYARQIDDAGNAEQEQCRECHGTGAIPYRDAVADDAITAAAVQAAGWEYRTCDDEVWWSHPDYEGYGDVYITVEPHEGSLGVFVGQDADAGGGWNPGFRFRVPGCDTMDKLDRLAGMLSGGNNG